MQNNNRLHAPTEQQIEQQGEKLITAVSAVRKSPDWMGQLLSRTLTSDDLKIRTLRFVDALPSLQSDSALVEHLRAYFRDGDLPFPGISRWMLQQTSTDKLLAPSIRKVFNRVAYRFLAGANIGEALEAASRLRRDNLAPSLDLLGEVTLSDVAATRYREALIEAIRQAGEAITGWPPNPQLDRSGEQSIPPLNLSLKLTSLLPRPAPQDIKNQIHELSDRLRPVLREARSAGLSVTVDMESYNTKDLILGVFQEVLMDPEFLDWPHAGIAIQTYLKSAPQDLERLLAWASKRQTPIHVRLVRGAYWDEELIHAAQHGWAVPVWEGRGITDQVYEQCMSTLFAAAPGVTPVIATHNLRSIALALALAEQQGMQPDQFELQMIWGMGGRIPQALSNLGYRLRIYAPFGELIPGMAYLVRRLLENSSSQQALDLFQGEIPDASSFKPRVATEKITIRNPQGTFSNATTCRFTDPAERYRFTAALDKVRGKLGRDYPLFIGGKPLQVNGRIKSLNPAQPEQVVGNVSMASTEHLEQAVSAAKTAATDWQRTTFDYRAELLQQAAVKLENKRADFAAWEIFETGKNWTEADADVAEAIDFLRYYAQLARNYEKGYLQDTPGQTNRTFYRGRGVGAVLPPWNFPLAILTGMTAATLVSGNTCVLKPASLTPVVGAQFARLMHELDLPPGALNFLPGEGRDIGDQLVRHPNVVNIAFTGSREVGLGIIQKANGEAGRWPMLKRVIAEMGGKNAIIVDDDADLEEAVSGIIQSAFGFQGQKCSACSRVIAVGAIHDRLVQMLIDASTSLRPDLPEKPGAELGPVIDAVARDRIEQTILDAGKYAHLHWRGTPQDLGFYVPPAIFTGVPPNSDLAQEEVFGPVIAVLKAGDLEEAIKLANATKYALTGGLYSRHPDHLQQASDELVAGNLYLNRGITGALVGRQPFGGFKHSGTGPKAGGPDYLLPFMEPRTIVENTLRKGAAPV